MAFLDNSGDIILDAVLTDLGREKMASGDFSVTYFALGDDEIDYSLYNKNHPSGSAYYDLEILQTPIFEAFTQTNSSINYGLLATTATDMLYMPILKINDKAGNTSDSGGGDTSCVFPSTTAGSTGLIWVTDSQNDSDSIQISAVLTNSTNDFALNYLGGADAGADTHMILIESGLNTDQIKGTSDNTSTYLTAYDLIDNYYYIFYDSRFINTIYGPMGVGAVTYQQNTDCKGNLWSWDSIAAEASTGYTSAGLENFSTARINAGWDLVYYVFGSTCTDTNASVIAGPRGNCAVLNLDINPNLDTEYSLYGTLNSTTVLPNNRAVDYIDTILYVQGVTTGAMIQIPLRIVRIAS